MNYPFLSIKGGFFAWLLYDPGLFLKATKILALLLFVLLIIYLYLKIKEQIIKIRIAERDLDKDDFE